MNCSMSRSRPTFGRSGIIWATTLKPASFASWNDSHTALTVWPLRKEEKQMLTWWFMCFLPWAPKRHTSAEYSQTVAIIFKIKIRLITRINDQERKTMKHFNKVRIGVSVVDLSKHDVDRCFESDNIFYTQLLHLRSWPSLCTRLLSPTPSDC